ncbi:MAG TPA: Uma2 family endonuclease [Trebonia sp.]|jgi:Uma2 family endonuclease
MAVMAVRRKRKPAWEEVPPEPVPVQDLLDLRERVDTGHRRAEVIEGQLIVSPMPVIWHERVCRWLEHSFDGGCEASDWFPDRAGEIHLAPTRDLIEPDFMILRDASTLPDLESLRPLDRVLLAAEVVSASSVRVDREVKPGACALAGIPLYLLVDRFTKPVTISLHSEPGANGYAKVNTVTVGEKLRLPAPFDLTLDTSSLPLPD